MEPAIYGTRWDQLIDSRYIKASIIPNAAVADLYRKAGVVLNDHWPDMQQAGILSNRVFDLLACAAPIVSDEIPDHPDGFSDLIAEFGPGRPIRPLVEQALNEDSARGAQRRAFAEVVRRDHSFDNRAAVILSAARALLARRNRQPTTLA
ncbi:MAG: glycosyltransferase family protein [Dongiaceae bacterium]